MVFVHCALLSNLGHELLEECEILKTGPETTATPFTSIGTLYQKYAQDFARSPLSKKDAKPI